MATQAPSIVEEKRPVAVMDAEKHAAGSNHSGDDSDGNSEVFQGGVQRVRAITSIWGHKTMWLMFAL
jgi:hypothetical protein